MSIEIVTSQYGEVINKLDEHSTLLQQILNALGSTKPPTYSATVTASSVAANKHHIALLNNNTTKKVKIKRIIIHSEVTATVTGFEISLRINKISALSGGTAITPLKFDSTDPDPTNISIVSNPSSATVVGTFITTAVNPEETGGQHLIDLNFDSRGYKEITLYNGEGITIQQYGTAGVGNISVTIIFTVE